MNSHFALCLAATAFVLVGFTFSVTESACFNVDSIKKFGDGRGKVFEFVKSKCAEEFKDNNDEANKKCADDKMKAAHEKCKAEGSDRTKIYQCFQQELGLPEITYEKYEECVLGAVEDESKKGEVKTALENCKNETGMKLYHCGMVQLIKGPCPEVKDLVKKMMENKKD